MAVYFFFEWLLALRFPLNVHWVSLQIEPHIFIPLYLMHSSFIFTIVYIPFNQKLRLQECERDIVRFPVMIKKMQRRRFWERAILCINYLCLSLITLPSLCHVLYRRWLYYKNVKIHLSALKLTCCCAIL